MNPDYSRLPRSPVEIVDDEGQDFFLDKDLEFYDDISIRKRVKPNDGVEIPAHFPHYHSPNEKPSVPTKPHYTFPQERNNFNRQPNAPSHRQPPHETHHRKLTPPTMSDDFIPLEANSPRDSQVSRRSDRPSQRGYNDDRNRDSYNRSSRRDYNDRGDRGSQRDYNDRDSQRDYNNRPSTQSNWNDTPSGRSWNDRSRQNNWGDNSSDRGDRGWGNRSQQGNWDDNSSGKGWNNSSQQRNWNDRGDRGSDRDYDKPPRKDWNNNNRSLNRREYSDSGSEFSDHSNRDRGFQNNRDPRNSYSRDRQDYGNRSYSRQDSRQDTKIEGSEGRTMPMDPRRIDIPPNSLLAKTLQLPIYPFKSEIIESIQSNQVTIISGDTGCGKSTQVPKYILEDCMRRGVECRIICTQPRRIAAITLAKRVQKEMAEIFPDTADKLVGYHIGMETNFNKNSKIIFVTNGIFLQRFIHEDENTEGGILKGFTHAILDEVHERDIDSDFIMVALKHVLSRHPNFKLTLMSATINAELFARYFSKYAIEKVSNYFFDYQKNQRKALTAWDDAPMKWEKAQENDHEELSKQTIENYKISAESTWGVPDTSQEEERRKREAEERNAQLTREKEEFKCDANNYTTVIEINQKHVQSKDKYVIHKKYLDQLKHDADIRCSLMLSDFSKKKAIFHEECIRVCLQLIEYLTSSRNRIETQIRAAIAEEVQLERRLNDAGKIWDEGRKRTFLPYMLIFLPGLSEIYHMMDVITEEKALSHLNLDLIPLHSTLSDFNQDRLFKDPEHPEQRKIILSTNIAESSITIPNVLYVIDFCLLKEINTSGRTGIEILDLVWASKASLQQRAGRTGRVSDGHVFRLVPETFYERDLDAFSKPELHRSPLDRLILRIKTLYESEKLAKKTENCLFSDPKQVLGRAIEPPQLESIAVAVRNLQDNGALTVSSGPDHLGEITFLGKVYCDLPCEVKISKMILLGLAFGLREEIIALAAVMCQRKSIFRPDTKAVPRNRYAYMRNLHTMADGTNSDHVALLRTFAFWELKFVPNEASVQKVRKMREREEEKDYCRDRLLDPVVLRETYITKQDIISRLRKLEILKKPEELMEEEHQRNAKRRYFWEDPDLDRSKINEKYAILKFVLAGAFYCTYIRPSELKRQFDTNQSNYIKSNTGMDPLKTIVIRHTYKGIENWDADKVAVTKQNWNKMLKKFCPEEIRFIQDKAYISFNDDNYEFSIKTLDYIKKSFYDISRQISVYNKEYGSNVREELTFRHTSNKQTSNIFYSHWMDPDCVSLFAGLGEVEYYSSYDFVDYLTRKKIKMDPDSINNIVPVKNPGAPICMVTQDYFEKKSGVLSAKYTTMIDFEFFECKFLLPLITMIFAPQIQLDSDEAKTRYKSMSIDGNELDLEFYLTSKDIEEINEIRHLLQDFFMNKDRHYFQNTYFSLWNSIQDLFKKERVLYIPQEKWEDRFKQEYENKLSKISVENVSKRLKKPALKKKEEELKTSFHYYLIPIQAKELPNAKFANYSAVQDAAKESQKYYSLYTEWKKAKVLQIKKNLRLIDQKATFLACGVCGTKLCDFTCIGDQIINGFYRHLKCSEFIFKVIACSSEDAFYTSWHLDKIKNHKFLNHGEYVQHNVLGCYQNHELALKVWHRDFSNITPEQRLNLYKTTQGVKTEGEGEHIDPLSKFPVVENLYITRFSNLKLVYPDDSEEPFSFDNYNLVVLMDKNRDKIKEREQRLQYLSCPICSVDRFDSKDDYKAHIKSRGHQEEYKKFVETLPEIPE